MTTLRLHAEPLREEWLDAYGHLNEAYYLVPFSNASWAMQDHFAIGVEYFKRTGGALYTVETHVRYLKEVRAPAKLEIETIVLGADAKRLWFAHSMHVAGELRATAEFMALHYNTRERRTTEMPKPVQSALTQAQTTPRPTWARARIGLGRD
ncbi:MAG: thioesterase family protein [bacterium]